MKQIHHAINNCKKNDPKHKNSRSLAHTHTFFIDTELFFDLSTVFRIEIKFISREMRKKSSYLFPTSRISVIATQQKFLAEEFCVFFCPICLFSSLFFFFCPLRSCLSWLRDYQHNRSKVLSLFHPEEKVVKLKKMTTD